MDNTDSKVTGIYILYVCYIAELREYMKDFAEIVHKVVSTNQICVP
jgi:hypothetical protein